jgi:LysM repeat protein
MECGGITRRYRKNGARRGLIWALAAASAGLSACAMDTVESLQTRFVTASKAAVRDLGPSDDSAKVHVVRPGETLSSVAARYRIHVDQLARANRLQSSDRIEVRQRLVIPQQRLVHRVRPGETMEGIAHRYRVRVSTIAHLNRKGLSREVRVGERLLLPTYATPPRVAAAPSPRAPAVAAPPPQRAEPAPRPARSAPDPRLERARGLVDRAVADYRAARFEAGLARAREAEEALGDLDGRDARRVSARAAFVTGSLYAARGEDERATESFTRVRQLDPSFEPPSGWLSPRLAKLYAAGTPD